MQTTGAAGGYDSAAPYEESHPAMQAVWLALRVRICRSKIGERLAQRDILQAKSEQILAAGEIPVCPGVSPQARFPCIREYAFFIYMKIKHRCNRIGAFVLVPHTRNLTRRVGP